MNKHRIRMTELDGDPIPVLWLEINQDSWLDVNIILGPDDNIHDLIDEFMDGINAGPGRPITYHTRSFNLFEGMTNYQEAIIE